MAMSYGATGAASVWLLLNIGLFFFEIPIMHRRVLRKDKWRWYWQDVTVPLIAGLSIAFLGRFLFNGMTSQFVTLLYLIVISVLTLGMTAIVTPTTKSWLWGQLLKIKLMQVYL
jgi:hypothetical protein